MLQHDLAHHGVLEAEILLGVAGDTSFAADVVAVRATGGGSFGFLLRGGSMGIGGIRSGDDSRFFVWDGLLRGLRARGYVNGGHGAQEDDDK